jgi:hypothetical protein
VGLVVVRGSFGIGDFSIDTEVFSVGRHEKGLSGTVPDAVEDVVETFFEEK